MEDYYAAFLRCAEDVDALHKQKRCIAAMHFGGVAVECLLKYMILASLPKNATKDWYDGTDETKNHGHTMTNPGHDYSEASNRHNRLRSHIEKRRDVHGWLLDIEKPYGHFIDMRYSHKEPEEKMYKEWMWKYRELIKWLQTEGMQVIIKYRRV
jgi:hypothetical protein